jgi:hypothetical protein
MMISRPTRSPTHREIEPSRLATLGTELDDIAAGDKVALAALVELAEDRGRSPAHYLAGLALASEYQLDSGDAEASVTLCVGNCQSWGALDCAERAIELWQQRLAAGQPGFRIAVKSCLDRCGGAAACVAATPAGTAVLLQATPEKLEEAVNTLLGA